MINYKINKSFKVLFLIFIISNFYFIFTQFVFAENQIELYFFWGSGCPHCSNMASVLQEIKLDYPQLEIKYFEVWYNSNNQRLMLAMADGYNFKPEGVPIIFVGERVFEGDGENEIIQLKETVRLCSINKCISPADKTKVAENKIQLKWDNIGILAGIIIFIFLLFSLFKKKKSVGV